MKLYFGSSDKQIKQIHNGNFLTQYKAIASCFRIDKNDLYGEFNKKYTSINWSYDIWNLSFKELQKNKIPEKIKIYNNAEKWMETNGNSIGYIYEIETDDYIENHLEQFQDSDIRIECIYNGHKKIKVKLIHTVNINWVCKYKKTMSDKFGFANIGQGKFEPPYSLQILKEKYPSLLNDKVHVWRAKNQIELIHEEPSFDEQKRIFYNWNLMSKKDKEISDKKCKNIFHCTNFEYHNWIMENKWHNENYFELSDIRQRYDKRDMKLNCLDYIHVSLSDKPITFVPRIPEHTFDLKGKWKQYSENKTIPRICCSNSIFGAISAIRIDENKTYYLHLLEPEKVMNNIEVSRYVPDALATGECWILDDEIKSMVIGKIKIGALLPYVYTFLKDKNNFRCVLYHDYDLEIN